MPGRELRRGHPDTYSAVIIQKDTYSTLIIKGGVIYTPPFHDEDIPTEECRKGAEEDSASAAAVAAHLRQPGRQSATRTRPSLAASVAAEPRTRPSLAASDIYMHIKSRYSYNNRNIYLLMRHIQI